MSRAVFLLDSMILERSARIFPNLLQPESIEKKTKLVLDLKANHHGMLAPALPKCKPGQPKCPIMVGEGCRPICGTSLVNFN